MWQRWWTQATRRRRSWWRWGAAMAVGGAWSAWCVQGDDPGKRFRLSVEIPLRFARCARTATAIVYGTSLRSRGGRNNRRTGVDYQSSLWSVKDDERRRHIISECNQRGADRLLSLAFANGGIYIKLGQHIGQLVDPLTLSHSFASGCSYSTTSCQKSTFVQCRRMYWTSVR